MLLDQFSEGLSILGFKRAMAENVEELKSLFVACKTATPDSILSILIYPSEMTVAEAVVAGCLKQYVKSCSEINLKAFLCFTTGAAAIPGFGLGKIKIKFDSTLPSIFASTCFNTVTFPVSFENQENFNSSLNVVMEGHEFNCM